jgi:gamma-glutamyltranspeptidase/glutathione hydrolase
MTVEDLAAYDVIWAPPIKGRAGRFEVATLPPPNYGGVGLIEAQQLAAAAGLEQKGHWSQSASALRVAVTATQAWMIGLYPEQYRRQLYPTLDLSAAARITPEHARSFWQLLDAGKLPAKWAEEGPKHSDDVVVIDREGNMAALTQSINCVLWGKTAINVDGISIGDPASFQQAQIKEAGPGRRLPDPTETGLVLDQGKPVLAFASMGAGLHQRTFQGIQNFTVYHMTVDQAIDAPDFFLPTMSKEAGGYVVTVPSGRFPKSVLEGTGLKFEEIGSDNARFGGEGVWVAISRDPVTGELRAASHNRSNSAALAY